MSKIIVVIGITGTQGSSVADTFLSQPGFKVRGLTRDLSKPKCQDLILKGVELIQADIFDEQSLEESITGAHIVFGNTAYLSEIATKVGSQQQAHDLEIRQGQNIADAVSKLDTLELFIWSSLSKSSTWSKGKYMKVWHFDSKAHVVDYIREKHSTLASKMSILQMGLFADNWKYGQMFVPWVKLDDASMVLRIPGSGDEKIPMVVPKDAGKFVYALTQLPVGTNLLAFGAHITWGEYIELWSKTTGVPARLERTTIAEHSKLDDNGGFAEEMAEMYGYMTEFGYHGGDPAVTLTTDIMMDVSPVRIEDYIRTENWKPMFG